MKIAVIVNSFPEISEKFLLNFVIGLMDAGADITVYAAHRPKSELRHDAFKSRNVAAVTRYAGVPRSLKARMLAAPGLFLRLAIMSPKAALNALRFGKYRTVAKNLKLLYFGNVLASERFDVVHCHFGVNGLIGAYLKDCGFAKTLVATFHGSDINTYPKRYGSDVYKALYASADLITANTSFTKGKIVANGCPERLIRVLPVGLIGSEYRGIDRSRIVNGSVLTVGRLEEKKGHRYMLEALRIISRQIPGVQYIIAGEGSLNDELRFYAEAIGVSSYCKFLGVCSSERVRELYSNSAVFCLPSVTAQSGDMEGQGLVLQEAQACGIPVVSTLHNGIPDGVLDSVSGFLVPEKDVEALAERITLLLRDESMRARMGKAGRDFVLAKYDIGSLTKELLGFYDEIVTE